MNGCEHYQDLISLLIDGEITQEEKNDLAKHVVTCRECAELYCAFRSVSDALSDNMVEPPERLSEDIMAQVRRSEIKLAKHSVKNNIIYLKRVAAAAACVAVICIGAITIPRAHIFDKASVAASAAGVFDIDAGPGRKEILSEEETVAAAPKEAMPMVDTSNSAQDHVTVSAEPTPVPLESIGTESSTPTVNLTGRGIGNKLAGYFSGSECDLPEDQSADRTLFIYYDPDGVTGEVLVKVFGQRVYYINLSGEESTAHLASCTWSELSALIG